ncbi:hypothetical protein [Pedobacter nutrimenti]|uniref:hypothetical protein n=1 Tax=Pedobacter nutrimenti TaxID=1241337 RepID=UPI00292F9393|nr:hypothetical protein [Pedobacter nutrimenti]
MEDQQIEEMVIVKLPFEGYAHTFCIGQKVNYSTLSLDEYLKLDKSLILVTWAQFNEMHRSFYKTPFSEISEQTWQRALEELPPLKWHWVSTRFNLFYCLEALSGTFHALYVFDKQTEKYYTGTKSLFMKSEEILQEISKEILNEDKHTNNPESQ